VCVRCSSILRQCASFSAESIVIACVPGGWMTASLPPGSGPEQHKTTEPAERPVCLWHGVFGGSRSSIAGRDSGHRAEGRDSAHLGGATDTRSRDA